MRLLKAVVRFNVSPGEQPRRQPTLAPIFSPTAHSVGRGGEAEEGGAGAPAAGRGEEEEGRGGAGAPATPGGEEEKRNAGGGGEGEKGAGIENAKDERGGAKKEGGGAEEERGGAGEGAEAAGGGRAAAQAESLRAAEMVSAVVLLLLSHTRVVSLDALCCLCINIVQLMHLLCFTLLPPRFHHPTCLHTLLLTKGPLSPTTLKVLSHHCPLLTGQCSCCH